MFPSLFWFSTTINIVGGLSFSALPLPLIFAAIGVGAILNTAVLVASLVLYIISPTATDFTYFVPYLVVFCGAAGVGSYSYWHKSSEAEKEEDEQEKEEDIQEEIRNAFFHWGSYGVSKDRIEKIGKHSNFVLMTHFLSPKLGKISKH